MSLVALACSLTVAAPRSPAALPDTPPNVESLPLPRVLVTISTNPAGVLTVTVDRTTRLTWQTMHDQGPQTTGGIQVAAGKAASAFELRAVEKEAVLEADGFSGWAAKVPRGIPITLRVDTQRHLIDLSTPPDNAQPVTVRFGDGGRAEIHGGSRTRFDQLLDGAYIFTGQGNVYTIDSAGLAASLAADRPPLTGGPVGEATATNRLTKHTPLSPVTTVRVTGEPGSDLTLAAAGQTLSLAPGETKTLRLTNGSVLEAKHNPTTQTLDWKVEKGYFRFQIEGMNCWRPLGLADQTAALQWNLSAKMGDVRNLSSDQDVLVDLAIRYFAEVGPKTTLQYSQFDDCTTFSVSATGGQALLFNAESGREYPLDLNSFLVRAGVPEEDATGSLQVAAKSRKTLVLVGQSGAPFQVQGALGNTVIAPNSQKTLQNGSSSQLQVNYDSGGRLTLQAVAGDYLILVPTSSGNVAVGLNQGDAVSLNGNPNGGQITFQTASGNLTPVVLNAGGQGWNFGPNAQATLKTGVGDTGFLVANPSGRVNPIVGTTVNEIAGANPNPRPGTPLTAPTTTPTAPNQIDGSLIQQLPVSPSSPSSP